MTARPLFSRFHASSILLSILLLALAGCASPAPVASPTQSPTELPLVPTPTRTPGAGGAPSLTEQPRVDACPTETTTFELAAAHDFWTETGFGDWHWQANGSVPVIVQPDGSVASGSSGVFPGLQFGTFSSGENACAFEAPAEVQLSLSGVCANGVLKLEASETWTMGTYDWTCDDDSFQAQVPPLPAAVHPDLNFPLQAEGAYTVDVPWLGGNGSKTYTLYHAIEPVPLVEP